MGQVFELYEFIEIVRNENFETAERLYALGDDGTNYQKTLEGKYGSDDPFLFFTLSESLENNYLNPWVIILLDMEYPIMQHLLKIRKNENDFKMSVYHLEQSQLGNNPPPPVSIIIFIKKEYILEYSKSSPLLLGFWNELKDLPESKRWVLFSDPLNKGLLAELQ